MKGKTKRVVLKVGTSVLIDRQRRISADKIADLARQIKTVQEDGIDVIVVSSGAVACGMETLNIKKKPTEIEKKQALASIGQVLLMKMYYERFKEEGLSVGQILLTHEDIKSKSRCLNLMNTINSLLNLKIVPVINENDALSFKEIKFGDNDNLSALIAQISDADLLLLLSDVKGLYDKDPASYSEARLIKEVERIDEDIERLAFGTKSEKSVGGMVSKLEAAKKASYYGIQTMIVKGDEKDVVINVIKKGENPGTLFHAKKRMTRNKWWTAFAFKVKGKVLVDQGAEKAILMKGKSLLPSGVLKAEGEFTRGECVEIENQNGRILAKGITNYSSTDINKIKGLKSVDIEKKLGYKYAEEIIHRNNMVMI
ncbi:MAG: glutamate 5-kinase [Syntrophorhabdaceae bacterium]|nr:glutamate 5-kinase [Syntrophorhabdaceae bacterium]